MPPTRSKQAFALLFSLLMITSMMGVALIAVGASTTQAQTDGNIEYRVNGGSTSVGAVDGGPDWTPPGSTNGVSVSGSASTYSTGDSISLDETVPSSTPSQVFQSERYGDQQWNFDVTAGQQYEVRLYFAEIFHESSNERVFDVALEGETVLNDYDIYADVGHDVGTMKSFTVTPTDGTLDVDFTTEVDNAKISAIEIVEAEPQPDTLGGPDTVNFGTVVTGDSDTKQVTVRNLGDGDDPSIDISDVSITGADAAEFTAGTASETTLAPGESADIPVTFAPDEAQAKSATLEVSHSGTNSPLTVELAGEGASDVPVGFGQSDLQGFSASNPTAIDVGPDDRVYVSTQGGTVYALEVERTGANSYEVVHEEQIDAIKDVPNHDDFGNHQSGENNRQVTGLTTGGTAKNPVVYVSSSDSKITVGGSDDIDTNSGTISRLTPEWNADGTLSTLDHEVLVMGLPRSEENHATNGLELSPDEETLYVAQGGHTNKGAPSNNFGYLPEYALSAAILEIDLAQIDAETDSESLQAVNSDYPDLDYRYALPTVQETELPFGGENGLNQAKIVPGGPVQVYSPGYRNSYDLVLTEDGQLYALDHDGNSGWGGLVVGEGSEGFCTNEPNEDDSGESGDQLHYVTEEGYYAGHPTPIRGNPEGAGLYDSDGNLIFEFNESNTPVPFDQANPIECEYQSPQEDNSIGDTYGPTGAIDEYTASNFGGEMQGDLLAVELFGPINRVQLNAAGDDVTEQGVFLNANGALGITAQGDDVVFPGTIWTANHGGNDVTVFEPNDYDPDSAPPDDDEPDNGDEAEIDPSDPFPLDDSNGLDTEVPVALDFEPNSYPGTILDLGFTGLMTNGEDPYVDLYDPDNVVAGGAANVLTVEETTTGDATNNDQEYAFQLGVNAPDEPFTIHSEVTGYPEDPQNYQSMGIFLGNGDQDNYAKLVVSANGGTGGVEFAKETDGTFQGVAQPDDPDVTGPSVNTDLYLTVYPNENTVEAYYATGDEEPTYVGETTIPNEWHNADDRGLAVGVISTSYGADSGFPATWRNLHVTPEDVPAPVLSADAGADQTVTGGEQVTLDATGSTGENLTYSWTQTAGPDVTLDDATSATPTFTAPEVDGDQTLTFEVEVSDGIDTETDTVTVTVLDVSVAEGDAVYRVNAGGPEISPGDDGPAWDADTTDSPSEYLASGGAIPGGQPFDLGDFHPSVPDGTPDEIFQYDRYDPPADPPMQWSFPAEEGETYEVRLYFHDAWSGTSEPGDRVFNVMIDGEYVLTNFDIVEKYGDNTAAMESFTVESDGSIDVEFEHVTENPQINGFEIVAVDEDEDGDDELTIEEAIAGLNEPVNKIDQQSIQQAINWWATGQEVPGTGGQTIDQQQMQQLINVWATGATVGEEDEANQPPTIDVIDDQTVTEGETAEVGVSATDPDGDDLTLSIDGPGFVGLSDAGDGTGTVTISPETGDAGTYIVEVTADDGEATTTESFQLSVEAQEDAPDGEAIFAVNAGGPEYTAADGTVYVADANFDGGMTFTSGALGTPSEPDIANTDDDQLYWTERYGDFSYDVPVDDGEYEVELQFAEIYQGVGNDGGEGDRLFDVSIEGQQVLDSYDIYAEAGGPHTAVTETFTAQVVDGELNVEFSSVEDNAKVSAIKVTESDGEPDDPNTPPTIDAIDDQTVAEGESIDVGVSATDPDGDDLTLSVDGPEFVGLSDAGDGTGTVTISPEDGDAGSYTVDVTADDGQDTTTESFQLTVEEAVSDPVAETLYRINAGESTDLAAVDDGPEWTGVEDDTSPYLVSVAEEGSGNYDGGDDVTPTESVPESTPDAVFDAERYGEMQWEFPVDAGTETEVRLYLSNQFPGSDAPGDRQFNVSIDGTQVLTNYDPVADVGHANGVMKSFVVTSDGTVQIDFELGEAENPQVNAIELVTVGEEDEPNQPPTIDAIDDQTVTEGDSVDIGVSAADPDGDDLTLSVDGPEFVSLSDAGDGTGTLTLSPEAGDAGSYTVEVTADDGQATATESFQLTVEEAVVEPETVFAVNAGGSEHTASDGTVFEADANFDGGITYGTSASIAATDDDPLYQTERYGDFSYDVPVDDGTYEVTLHFAEIYLGTDDDPDANEDRVGERVFDVSIEGEEVLSAYDIYAEVGTLTATQETFTVEVTDGELTVEFVTVEDNAKISAIEISEAEDGGEQ